MDKKLKGAQDELTLRIAAWEIAKTGACPGNIDRCVDISLRACSLCVLQWLRNRAELELELASGAGGWI